MENKTHINYTEFVIAVEKMRAAQERHLELMARGDYNNANQILFMSKQLEVNVDNHIRQIKAIQKDIPEKSTHAEDDPQNIDFQIAYMQGIRTWHEDLIHPLAESSHIIRMCKAIESNLTLLQNLKANLNGTN